MGVCRKYDASKDATTFDAIIIGSGIGGLTAASLLAKCGKKVAVFEQHYVPGGFSQVFKRRNYQWDVGVHYVGQMGIRGSLMERLFAFATEDRIEWADMDSPYDVAYIGEYQFSFRKGKENHKKALMEAFPSDEDAIEAYFEILEKVNRLSGIYFGERTMPPFLSKTAGHFMRRPIQKYACKTTYEVLRELTDNETLIACLCARCGNHGLPPKESSFIIHAAITEHFMEGGTYPVGGAEKIGDAFVETLANYEGKVFVRSGVDSLLLKGQKAIGVRLESGEEVKAKYVISNTGLNNSLRHLIPQKWVPSKWIEDLDAIGPAASHICLYVGLNADAASLKLPKFNVWVYPNDQIDRSIQDFYADPSAPLPLVYISFPAAKDPQWDSQFPGRSTIQVVVPSQFEWVEQWQESSWMKRGTDYESFKAQFQKRILEQLLHKFPQIEAHIDYVEVSTPVSTRHFTRYSHGEIYGLAHNPQRFTANWIRPYSPIKNFRFTGQDILSVGVGGALFSGFFTAFSILKLRLIWQLFRGWKRY